MVQTEITSYVEGKTIFKRIYTFNIFDYNGKFFFVCIFSDDFKVYVWKVPDTETMANKRSFTKHTDDEICELCKFFTY